MIFALYGFLGWAFFILLKEIKQQGAAIAGRQTPGIIITIDQEQDKSGTRHFSSPNLIIGRDPGSDIILNDDTASTRHAQITYHHNQWWITDLASTNGTFLNGALVKMPTVITSGDKIRCGNKTLLVTFSSDVYVSPTKRLEKSND